jgi:hypothetical protein
MSELFRAELTPLPERMRHLRVFNGYPVPWFVPWKTDGTPEFRVVTHERRDEALRTRSCWVCGDVLGRYLAFVLGPMCGITRTTSEPPCHRECAHWSVVNCPFLNGREKRRRDDELTKQLDLVGSTPGFMIPRQPNAVLIWVTKSFERFDDGRGNWLLRVGSPLQLSCWSGGKRCATSVVRASIESGFPTLYQAAEAEGPDAVKNLIAMRDRFEAILPREDANGLGQRLETVQ